MAQKLVKSPQQVRDDYLKTIKNGLQRIGISNPNVSENSDYWITATALADQISVLFNNIEILGEELMPDTATGENLDRLLTMFGLTRRGAGVASGQIQFVTSAATLVPVGSQLTSSTGKSYEIVLGGIYENNAILNVVAVEPGADGNLAIGAVLNWVTPPYNAQSTCLVFSAIKGGVNAEDDETARARLLTRLANPPGSGNWQQIAEIAESSDPVVQKAFIYQAANGPSTLHIAVAGYPGTSSKSREIESFKMNSSIIPSILGSLPEYYETVITTVDDVSSDVAFSITIPNNATQTIGNGWLNFSQFPRINNTSHFFCKVTTVTNSTNITIDSPAGSNPSPGISLISWIDRTTWTVKTSKILSFTGTGPYVCVLETPLAGIAVNDFIFPACANAQNYLNFVLEQFKNMGPGEKTNIIEIYSRAARKPKVAEAYPYTMDGAMLRALINAGDEIQAASFCYRGISTPALQQQSGVLTPALPSVISDAPKIFIPRNIAFYPEI